MLTQLVKHNFSVVCLRIFVIPAFVITPAFAVQPETAPEISTFKAPAQQDSSPKKNITENKAVNFEHDWLQEIETKPAKSLVTKNAMAVTANPHATKAAIDILKAGGSAIDAAIAAQLVLGLVEPQSSGIGGGAFLVYWDAGQKKIITWDGRETAPAAVDENWFLDDQQKPMKFFDAVVGGKAVGVPGIMAMFEKAHQQHGKLQWNELFKTAIELSENGFEVSPRLNQLLENLFGPEAEGDFKKLYYPKGEALKTGEVFKNPDYAKVLTKLSEQGAKYFYQGELAEKMVTAVQSQPRAGKLSLDDLKNYQAKQREPLCVVYLHYEVCGMGPPSSGGFTVASILGVMENFQVREFSEANLAHAFMEASKLAFADRNHYLADTDFVEVPLKALLDKNYLKARASLIKQNSTIKKAEPGLTKSQQQEKNPELPSTTHLSIVDQYGNVVSMTSSIEMAFGSRVVVEGFLLNNQLTDFSFLPNENLALAQKTSESKNTLAQIKIANRVQANKRPRSSMSPTIVLKNNKPVLAIGSPGGSRIIDFVARPLMNILAQKRDIQTAINQPHWIAMNNGKVEVGVEDETIASDELIKALQEKGQTIKSKTHSSGLHVIQISEQGLYGAADKRREGAVSGF